MTEQACEICGMSLGGGVCDCATEQLVAESLRSVPETPTPECEHHFVATPEYGILRCLHCPASVSIAHRGTPHDK